MDGRPLSGKKRPAESSPDSSGMVPKRPGSAPGIMSTGSVGSDDEDVHISDDDGESDDDDGMAAPPFAFDAPPAAGGRARRPTTAPVKKKSVALGAQDEQAKQSLRKSFNTCPICKMPLCTDSKYVPDKKWNKVQSWFKSKPASIIQDGKGRPINSFGLAPGVHTNHAISYNRCHFLHNVASTASPSFNGIWQYGYAVLTPGVTEMKPIRGFAGEDPRDPNFLQCLNVTKSIFKDVVGIGPDGNALKQISNGFLFNPLNITTLNVVMKRISAETITACWDCNSKMTQTDYIKTIFSNFFPMPIPFPELGFKHAQRTNVELHYIMLQILMTHDSVFDAAANTRMDSGVQSFQMNHEMSKTWRLNLGITWCMLMIMSSQWNIRKLDNATKHHEIYILHGTSDFYLSLLLYIVYAANYDIGRSDIIEFEEFHYFYASNFVFYLKKEGLLATNVTDSNNLSASILHRNAMPDQVLGGAIAWAEVRKMDWPEFSETTVLDVVPKTVKIFHDKVVLFIEKHFKVFCNQLNNWNHLGDTQHFTAYFPSPARVKTLSTTASSKVDLSINTFIDVLGSSGRYWFPFKHITMVQIANALGDAYNKTHPNFKPIFSLWYSHASTSALLLSRAPSLVESHRAEADDDDVGLLLSRRLTLAD